MAFGYTGGASSQGSSTAASVTHGQIINSGDLVVAYVHYNSTGTITADEAGWTNPVEEVPSAETATQALYWKIAGGFEPESYGWTLGTSSGWLAIVKVFTSSTAAVVDSAANTHRQGSTGGNLICGAADGRTISDGAVSLIFGGKDNRAGGTGAFTAADNSYDGVLGNAGNQQCTGGAHRIYVTGELFSGDITLSGPPALTDNTYSCHISFVEGGGGGGSQNLRYSILMESPLINSPLTG